MQKDKTPAVPRLTFVGAAREVTGSCVLVETATARFLVAAVVGKAVGVGGLLGPSGQKLQFQIQFSLGLLTHLQGGRSRNAG